MASNSIEGFLKGSYPLVVIPAHLLEYIREIVEQCPDEVSWVMEVTEKENYTYEIDAVYIPRQKVHGTTTEFDAEDILHLMDNEPEFKPEKWRGWGHSHVNMGTTPSGQDKTTMMEFAKDCEFFVGMIHNKKGDVFCWVVDNTRNIFFKDVTVEVYTEYEDEIKKLLKERVSKLVETPKTKEVSGFVPHTTTTNSKTVPFDCLGHKVEWVTQMYEGISQSGFKIKGVFFPSKTHYNAYTAVMAYEALRKDSQKLFEDQIDTLPSAHQMEIFDELEDFERDFAGHSTF